MPVNSAIAPCDGGRKKIDRLSYAEIDRLRSDAADADANVLSSLLGATDQDGKALTNTEIRDQIMSLIAGSYETTPAAMAWTIYGMLSTPGVWERAAAEVEEVLGDRRPTADDLRRLTYVDGVVREALRLYPVALGSARYVARGFEFAGRRIRQGSMVFCSSYVTHRSPELWPEPLEFRPQRWDPAEPGYQRRRTDVFLPFAAGPHRCLGAELATTEITVMLVRLLARTSLHLPEQRIWPTNIAAIRPAHGLQVDVLDWQPAARSR